MKRLFTKFVSWIGDRIDTERPADGPPPKSLWPFMGWCLKGAWPVIIVGAIFSMCASFAEVSTMYLLGEIVDIASAGGNVFSDNIGLVILAAALLLVIRPLFFASLALTQAVMMGPSIFKQTLVRLHRWTLGQDVTFFDNDFAGRIAQKQNQTANSMTEVVVETVNALVYGVAAILGTMILLVGLDFRLAGILAVWFVLYVLFLRAMLPLVRSRSAKRAGARANVTGQIVDTITNIKTVKLFSGRDHEDAQAISVLENLRLRSIEFGEVNVLFRLGLVGLAGVLPVAMVGSGLSMLDSGITPGDIAALGALTIRIAQMTGWISFTIMGVYGHLGEVEDGIKTLTPDYKLTDASGAKDIAEGAPEVRFDKVTFAYGRDVGGIWDVNLAIAPGERVGLVGASGAGKSTLVSLILRLYDTEEGTVSIANQDVRTVTQDSLRKQIGMVTQETAMFNRSARENVAYGRPNASVEEIENSARRAEAHEFILGLEDHEGRRGYDAHLGERGVKLSGGQRQRIALARAIIKDAPILVLDEATSALDSEVEAEIQAALDQVMDGKTVVAIAHRLSTIARMDRIIVMDQGRIAEEGTHTELLEKGGLYAGYWARQSDGFIGLPEAAE